MKPTYTKIGPVISNPRTWLVLILILAAVIRLVDLTDEPLELHPTRQFRALIIARSFYYPTAEEISSEQTAFAEKQANLVGLIEPSILEFMTAQMYKLSGQELTWLGRIFPISAWLLAGLAVFSIGRQIGSTLGGFISLTYFLFLPYGARFSRVLMADPLMVAGIAASLWALFTWTKRRELKYALIAGTITGLTILLKSIAGLILIFPFALFLLSSFSIKDLIKNKQVWLILLLAALPTGAYYYYGLVIDGRLATQFKGRFFPEVWRDLVFYKSWALRIIREFNIVAFIAGLLGIVLAKTKRVRLMLLGWWAGYFFYAMLFAYYTWTHDYYHLPMVPLVAVSLSPAIAALQARVTDNKYHRPVLAAIIGVCILIAAYGSYQTISFLTQNDYRATRTSLEELGDTIKNLPPGKVIGLTDDYETSFSFYNFISSDHWPSTGDINFRQLQGGSERAFDQLWQLTDDASYFFVTDFRELEKQPDLMAQLSHFPMIAESGGYRLYAIAEQPAQ